MDIIKPIDYYKRLTGEMNGFDITLQPIRTAVTHQKSFLPRGTRRGGGQ